jgi:hypothetical protein
MRCNTEAGLLKGVVHGLSAGFMAVWRRSHRSLKAI